MTLSEYIESEINDTLSKVKYFGDQRGIIYTKHVSLIDNISKLLRTEGSCVYKVVFDSIENHRGFSYPYLSDIVRVYDTSIEKYPEYLINLNISKFRDNKISTIL